MQVAIAAASNGIGEFVWMSWEQHSRRGMWPTYGNLAQVYTVPFARRLRDHTKKNNPTGQHWDTVLLRYLNSKACTQGTCFCKPSLGGFYAHVSGCEVAFAKKERKCEWKASWRGQFVGALTRVELQSFGEGCKIVTQPHTFDPAICWKK